MGLVRENLKANYAQFNFFYLAGNNTLPFIILIVVHLPVSIPQKKGTVRSMESKVTYQGIL